jgi:hypothetical protein
MEEVIARAGAAEPEDEEEGRNVTNGNLLWKEIQPLVREFNSEIQTELHDRRYRFRVHKLFRQRARAGAAMGEDMELDYISDDDDVAFMFEKDDGEPYVVVGNVEQIAVSTTPVDRANIGDAGYLNALPKEYKARVQLDNGEALFICRWYEEHDAQGNRLEGYGNKRCCTYKLPLAMAEPFNYISIWQVVATVAMSRIPHQARMYRLGAGDR